MGVDDILSSVPLWTASCAIVAVVLVQALLFTRQALRHAPSAGLSPAQCMKAFRRGVYAALPPSLAGAVAAVGMTAVVGAPQAWSRLCVIGSAAAEMSVMTIAAEALGISPQGALPSLEAAALAFFIMALNGCGWMFFVYCFNHRMEDLRKRLERKDPAWVSLASVTVSVGLTSSMACAFLTRSGPEGAAALASGATALMLLPLSRRNSRVREYLLALSMLAGVAAGFLFARFFREGAFSGGISS